MNKILNATNQWLRSVLPCNLFFATCFLNCVTTMLSQFV